MLARPLLAAVALVLASCAGFAPFDRASLPSAARYPGARSVVLDDRVSVRFEPDPHTGRAVAIETRSVRRLLLQRGAESLATVRVPHDPVYRQLVDLRVRTVDVDGRERRWGRGDASEAMLKPGYALYSDDRVFTVNAEPALPGTVVEWRATWRVTEPRLNPVVQTFGDTDPVVRASLTVTTPAAWRIDALARRLGEDVPFEPAVTEAEGLRRTTWERRDLTGLSVEPLGPTQDAAVDKVMVRLAAWREQGQEVIGFADPRALSAWLAGRMAEQARVTPEVQETACKVRGDGDDEAHARRLYAWVRDRVNYCAISIGEGGHVPHAAGEVLRTGYGDCKDKATLLRALLAASGIESWPVIIYNHDGLPRRFGLPTLAGNFNHAILQVALPGGARFLDPTARTASFEVLPPSDEGADVLPLRTGGAPLERTPIAPVEANSLRVVLWLDPDGAGVRGRFSLVATGAQAASLRAELLQAPADQQPKVVASRVALRQAQLGSIEIDGLEPGEGEHPVEVRGRVQVESMPGRAPGSWVVRPADLVEGWVRALPSARRVTPILMRSRREQVQEIHLSLPPGSEPAALPVAIEIAGPGARYQLKWRRDGGALVLQRLLRVEEPRVAPPDYAEAQGTFARILEAEAGAVVVHVPGGPK